MGVNASTDGFQFYETGVLDDTLCPLEMNHAVLVVGYGNDTTTGLDYWLVKNSYGKLWGDKGYIKIAITDGTGICGIQQSPIWPNAYFYG